jgi:hypothetical protein
MKERINNSNKVELSYSVNRNENVSSNSCIYYGPIRFYRRRRKAPTLLTGRKSKFEELQGEEKIQRELRREKNRLLSRRLKETRENILDELLQQVKQLEQRESYLLNYIEQLKLHKKDLFNKLDNSKQDPLFNLINQNQFTLFFEQYDYSSFDTDSIISSLTDEQPSLDYLLSDESQ